MKCKELNAESLARAYRRALEDAGGKDVEMDVLAPHLKETGSSCGACPALLTLAKKVFEAQQAGGAEIPAIIPDLFLPGSQEL